MQEVIEKLRNRSRELLENEEVDLVIGWGQGQFYWQSPPVMAERPEEVDELTFNPLSTPNLAKYVIDLKEEAKERNRGEPVEIRIALWTRGCDARAVNRLIQDGRVKREELYILGLSCPGTADSEKIYENYTQNARIKSAAWASSEDQDFEAGSIVIENTDGKKEILSIEKNMLDKCKRCTHPTPVEYDQLFGAEVEPHVEEDERFNEVSQKEEMELEERYNFWTRHFDRCIRCYACRNVCSACNCTECVFDSALPDQPDWLSKASTLSEKRLYHLIRLFHVAGRCIECGECSRVCPVNIPVQDLMQKAASDIDDLFGPFEAGIDRDELPPLQTFSEDDPEIEEGMNDEISG